MSKGAEDHMRKCGIRNHEFAEKATAKAQSVPLFAGLVEVTINPGK